MSIYFSIAREKHVKYSETKATSLFQDCWMFRTAHFYQVIKSKTNDNLYHCRDNNISSLTTLSLFPLLPPDDSVDWLLCGHCSPLCLHTVAVIFLVSSVFIILSCCQHHLVPWVSSLVKSTLLRNGVRNQSTITFFSLLSLAGSLSLSL